MVEDFLGRMEPKKLELTLSDDNFHQATDLIDEEEILDPELQK